MKPHPAPIRTLFGKTGRLCASAAARAARMAPGLFFRVRRLAARLWTRILSLPVSHKSLRLRLSLFFSLFLLTAWLAAALFTWQTCREYINEFFDSQQMLVARTLAVADVTRAPDELPRVDDMLPGVKKHALGELEDEAIAFAIFSTDGQRLLADGKKGQRFPFEPSRRGFVDEPLRGDDDVWRIL